MKNKYIIRIFISCLFIVLIGCNSDDDITNTTPSFQAEINGVLFEGATVLAGLGNDGRHMEIAALNSAGDTSMNLVIGDINNPNSPILVENTTYAVNNDDTYFDYQILDTFFITSAETGGAIIITEINTTDKTISGTFSGIIFDYDSSEEQSVMNGVFTNLPYLEY